MENIHPEVHSPPGCTNFRLSKGPRESIRMDLILGIPRSMVGSLIHSSSIGMSPNLPDKVLFRGTHSTLLLHWAFHGRGGYSPHPPTHLQCSGGLWLRFAIGHLSQDRFADKSTLGRLLTLT